MQDQWTQSRLEELHNALMSAFPSIGELERFTSIFLETPLDSITPYFNNTLDRVVFDLIQWARKEGRIGELLTAALRANPYNLKTNEVFRKFEDESSNQSSNRWG